MKELKDKVAVVTGAGSGIGRALAFALNEAGVQLALNDLNEDALAETAADLPPETFTKTFDVSDRDAVYAFAGEVQDRFGSVDILINNAGFTLPLQLMEDIKENDFRKVLEVNLWGVIYGTLAFIPFLKNRPEASLVNLSSVFGIMGYPLQGPYSISKFAVRGFTETLRIEMKNSNITFTSVHPGGIKTNIVRNIQGMEPGGHRKFVQQFDKMARSSPEEAAAKILEGIRNKKARVLIGSDARYIDRIVRLIPSTYERVILRKFDPDKLT